MNRVWRSSYFKMLPIQGLMVFIFTLFVGSCTRSDISSNPFPNVSARNLALRDKYETLLFNHLLVRDEFPMENRYKSIQKMAKDGFEAATLALDLYDIEHTDLKTNNNKAEEALNNLAEKGDITAQCLYAFYWDTKNPPERWQQYLINAANAGVARCMDLRASRLEKEHSPARFYWLSQSAYKGDLYGQTGMAFAYSHGEGVPKDLKRAVCWAIEARKSGSHWGESVYQDKLFFYQQDHPNTRMPLPSTQFCHSVVSNS